MFATLAAAALTLAQAAPADPSPAPRCRGEACVVERDLTPRFLDFWRQAQTLPPDDRDARFALWQRVYGFAAVPPGPRGEAIARDLLDGAWSRYPAAMFRIEDAGRHWWPDPLDTLVDVRAALGATGPTPVRLVRFVGCFERNAFTASGRDMAVVSLPVEDDGDRALLQAHEFAHAVHMATARLSAGWERSIAQTALMEGVAMHAARVVVPGRPAAAYLSDDAAWVERAMGRRQAILRGIRDRLTAKDGETVFRFTMGKGTTGLTREAYAAGWWIVEQLRHDGMTLAQIAHVPEPEMAALATRAIDTMLEVRTYPKWGRDKGLKARITASSRTR